jgi:2-polyprenyl-3-methyl-5-hydroxy-6-metoxy-1,4-benzoquinol methylase
MEEDFMLSKRYAHDNKSTLKLNALQQKMKEQINQKVAAEAYRFEEIPCCICDGYNFAPLAEKDRYGLYAPVVICKTCGLVQTNPRMDEKSYNLFYNSEYRKLYLGKKIPDEEYFSGQYGRGRNIYKFLQRNGVLNKREQAMNVLEVGCSTGGILKYFRDKGCSVRGIDLGEEYLEYGRRTHDLHLSVGTVLDTHFGATFDLVIYNHVLEHTLDPNSELKKVHDILSETGILYICVPGVKNLKYSYQSDFLRLLQNAHTYHFSQTTLRNLLRKNGFEMIVGNEGVRSVFRKERKDGHKVAFENDYLSTLWHLSKSEAIRIIYPLPPIEILRARKKIEADAKHILKTAYRMIRE